MATIKTLNNLDVTRINNQENIIYSDLEKNFVIGRNNDIKLLENDSAIIQSLWNILLTKKGELPFLNDFGTNLDKYLFEQATEDILDEVKDEFIKEINKWDSRVAIIDVKFQSIGENGVAKVDLLFSLNGEVKKQSFPIPT